jgi:RNA polymerase sigma-70 factor (ECF subfamily)
VDGFETFFEATYGDVLRAVEMVLRDSERAEEVTQEAFVRAFTRWRSVRKMDRPQGWVVVVAINAERRRWRREPRSEVFERSSPPVTVDHAGTVVTSLSVRDALDRLTLRQRAAVVLRYLADLPIPEIARALGCAEGTVRATLHQSLTKLRVDLRESEL